VRHDGISPTKNILKKINKMLLSFFFQLNDVDKTVTVVSVWSFAQRISFADKVKGPFK